MVLALVSCKKNNVDPIVPPAPVPEEKVPIKIALSVETKATDAAYEDGDKVGVYVSYEDALAASGSYLDNKAFTLMDGSWTSSEGLYWADNTTTADFYCYYPYGTPVNATAYTFHVKSDQSALADYKASDFLWGKTLDASPTSSAVAIKTAHLLSNILIYLEPGAGFTLEEFAAAQKAVKINNVKTNAVVNLSSGSVTASGDASVVTPYWSGECYKAIVVPQIVNADSNLVVVTVGGVTYTLAKEFTFASKTQHKLTITVNKATSGLNISIESWLIDETEHSGDAR